MADIRIERAHALGLLAARKVAFKWAEQAGEKFDMTCTYEEGATCDLLSFSRSGVNGSLAVTEDSFELSAKLGLLLGAFKKKIEGEIARNLDALLRPEAAATTAAKAAAKNKSA
jgi:putative polyhydroxyalkanoate system protein